MNVSHGLRPCYSIRLGRARDVAAVLEAIRPWLAGKSEHADLMLEFIRTSPRSEVSGRAAERARTGDNLRWAAGFTQRHLEIVARVRALNRRYGRGQWTLSGPARPKQRRRGMVGRRSVAADGSVREAPYPDDLAWLGGLIDGEGTLSISLVRAKGRRPRFKVQLSVANTNSSNIQKVASILLRLIGISPAVVRTNVRRGYRPCYVLRVQGQKRVRTAVEALVPHLAGKRTRAELILQFLDLPLDAQQLAARTGDDGRCSPDSSSIEGYGPRHLAIVEKVRRLNRRYGLGAWNDGALELSHGGGGAGLPKLLERPAARLLRQQEHVRGDDHEDDHE